jgi:hypothetical protein
MNSKITFYKYKNVNRNKESLKKGEDSSRQFKEKITHIDKLAIEIAAFANTNGNATSLGMIMK